MEWKDLQTKFEEQANKSIKWINNEYSLINSGRISVSIFNNVKVAAYDSMMPLNQVSNIQIVNATQVVIKPYDMSLIQEIAKGINQANLNVNPIVNADCIRINFPPQTEESRKLNVKKAKQILESAKIKIRDVRKNIQSLYKNNDEISEDLIHYFEDELNKITKKYNNDLENIFKKKEKELMSL